MFLSLLELKLMGGVSPKSPSPAPIQRPEAPGFQQRTPPPHQEADLSGHGAPRVQGPTMSIPSLSCLLHRPNAALESCSFARHSLLQTLYNI